MIDPVTLEVLPDGEEGELVLTSLTKQAMPVVRYRTRDLTRLLPGTAYPAFRRMQKVTGRTDDMMIVRGVNVFPSQIEEQLLAVEGLTPHYLCVLTRPGNLDELTVQVEHAPGCVRRPASLGSGPGRPGQAADRGQRPGGGARPRGRSSARWARPSGSATCAEPLVLSAGRAPTPVRAATPDLPAARPVPGVEEPGSSTAQEQRTRSLIHRPLRHPAAGTPGRAARHQPAPKLQQRDDVAPVGRPLGDRRQRVGRGQCPAPAARASGPSSQATSSAIEHGEDSTVRAPACSQAAVIPIASSPERTETRPSSQAESTTVDGVRGSRSMS